MDWQFLLTHYFINALERCSFDGLILKALLYCERLKNITWWFEPALVVL